MRITAGMLKNREIRVPKNIEVRPTSSKVRAAVFDVLIHRALPAKDLELESCSFLDACAGTGIMGFEALSRGAQTIIFMDKYRQIIKAIEANATRFGVESRIQGIVSDIMIPVGRDKPVDVCYIDPPYKQQLLPKAIPALEKAGWIGAGTVCVCEESSGEVIELPTHYDVIQRKVYGTTQIIFAAMQG